MRGLDWISHGLFERSLVLLIPVLGAIVTLPLLLAYWLLNPIFLATISRRTVSGLFFIWLLMPWAWVFLGKPRNSVFTYDFVYITHRLWGGFTIPHNADYWPFF
jgi:hypothetical protein